MGSYFLDTSAIVKRYVPTEPGHTWIVTLCNPVQSHKLYIAQAASVEVVAAICRKTREGSITTAARDRLITRFRWDVRSDYDPWRVTNAIYTSAGNLCRSHRLRAYDAVQLACALGVHNQALASGAPSPIFVCADNNLLNIAIAEGLGMENPNNYP